MLIVRIRENLDFGASQYQVSWPTLTLNRGLFSQYGAAQR